jgi:hypothetical protein
VRGLIFTQEGQEPLGSVSFFVVEKSTKKEKQLNIFIVNQDGRQWILEDTNHRLFFSSVFSFFKKTL